MKENRIGKVKIINLVLLGLLTSVFLIGCENDDELQQTQNKTDEVEIDTRKEQQSILEYISEIESLQGQTEFLNEQKQYLITVIQKVMENFSDEEMLEFSRNQFVYNLQVNGESIPENGRVNIPEGGVEISLSEKGMGYDFLPPEWLEKGRISGNYIDHLLNFDTSNWIPWGTDGTVITAQGYKATNLKAGERFSVTITDELNERLNLETNIIQIEVN